MDKVEPEVRVINLAQAPGERKAWGRPAAIVYLWGIIELFVVTNPLQISSKLRVKALRCFGAEIGDGVVFRPRTRVKFPWKLKIGDGSWIGEGAWLHNQDQINIGSNVVISQDTFVTTGSHRVRNDMALITLPVTIDDGAWICAKAIVLGGSSVGRSAVVTPGSVLAAKSVIPPGEIWGHSQAKFLSDRY